MRQTRCIRYGWWATRLHMSQMGSLGHKSRQLQTRGKSLKMDTTTCGRVDFEGGVRTA